MNECTESQGICGTEQECINTHGGYKCIDACPQGYQFINGRCIGKCIQSVALTINWLTNEFVNLLMKYCMGTLTRHT